MINELYQLAEAIDAVGIKPTDWHKNFKPLPKSSLGKPCFRVELGEKGRIDKIRTIPPEEVTVLRKWEKNLGHAFPGFNMVPPFRIADEEQLRVMGKWARAGSIDLDVLRSWCENPAVRNDRETSDLKLQSSLNKIPFDELLPLLGNIGDIPPLELLFQRLEAFRDEHGVSLFVDALVDCIWRELEDGNEQIALLSLLCHKGNINKKVSDDKGSSSLYLDVVHPNGDHVAHQKVMELINSRLMQGIAIETSGMSSDGVDAFGIEASSAELSEKQPPVVLPFLGNTILRSMASDKRCQQRYGRTDAESFPTSAKVKKATKAALEWISAPERKGDTWGAASADEILFAYPIQLPPAPIFLIQMFGVQQEQSASPARFEECASAAIKRLSGMTPAKGTSHLDVRLFAIRKMDTARRKVVFSRNYTAQRLEAAAREWAAGCNNLPMIGLRGWGEARGEIIPLELKIPFPLAVIPRVYEVWSRDGAGKGFLKCRVTPLSKKRGGNSIFEGIEILLGEELTASKIRYFLNILLQNAQSLLISLGNHVHGGGVLPSSDSVTTYVQEAIPIFGLFLHKLKILKESYMNDLPYAVGKMLKVADELHALYSTVTRKSADGKPSLPPQLIGNALLVAALANPVQAIAMLAERMCPYLAWAQTNQTEKAGLSRYYLKEFSEIEKTLRGKSWPQRLSDTDKAQLFLGYLSKSGKIETSMEQQDEGEADE